MNSRRVTSIRKDRNATVKYGDDKATPGIQSKNHNAKAERPMKKLRELLCRRGTGTDGKACGSCEAACRFGKEYLERKQADASPRGTAEQAP